MARGGSHYDGTRHRAQWTGVGVRPAPGVWHLPVRDGRRLPAGHTGGGTGRMAALRRGWLLRRYCRGFVPAFGRRRPRPIVLDALLQPRRAPLEDVRRLRPGDVGSLRAGVLAVCPGTPADMVQPVSISRILSQTVLAGDHPARPGDADRLDRQRSGSAARLVSAGRPAVHRAPKRVAASGEGPVLPVRVAGCGLIGGGRPRASHVHAVLPAGGAVSGGTRGGWIVRRIPRLRSP